MDTIIGIDLGTSTTEAAIYQEGKPVIILNFDGKEVTPSVVGIDDTGNMIVGEKAEAQLLLAPERTAREVKRLIGTEAMVTLGKRNYSPVEISSMILSYVRNYAGRYLDSDISRAVISVPAYFDELQRQETMEAGRAAGFMVDRIINEPTAAALSYGLEHMDEESYVLVYDLGGGTFDVTLLEMFEGVLEVKASSGDNKLGGKDFDERLIQYLTGQFQDKNGIDLTKDTFAMARVRDEALHCKIALSTEEEYRVQLPVLVTKDNIPYAMDEVVTRAKFEELIQDLVARTHEPIDVVLSDSGISADQLDKILLVGGSTRVPLVRRDIEAYFGKKPEAAVDPDYAVAQGAAIQAAIISGQIDESSELVMTDVNPYTLGVRALRGYDDEYMSVIIPRNKTIPTTKKRKFYTSWDGQTMAVIEVYQGESSSVRYNHCIGEFKLKGIPARAAGKEEIEVAFSYNQNGMLQVTGTIVSTGEEVSIDIDMLKTKEKRVDVSGWKEAELASDYRSFIRRAERWLKGHEGDKKVDDLLYRMKKAVLEEDDELAEDIEGQLRYYMGE
ncbi:MAG: Hsp70 family protein [Lachnospiraceae bacterium]|nr:Hsp70 family protein [Lachnospiraceae bacterium]